jgi:hypothetical protein
MHARNKQIFTHGLCEDSFARVFGLCGVGIKQNRHGGLCRLNMRIMDNVAPYQQASFMRVNAKPAMPRRMTR